MAGKQDGTVADLTVEILRDIRDGVNQTNARLDGLRQDMEHGFALLGQRMDNMLLGPHRQDHDDLNRRVTRLEQHLELGGG